MADDRCPRCGALFALVGRKHLCRPSGDHPRPSGDHHVAPVLSQDTGAVSCSEQNQPLSGNVHVLDKTVLLSGPLRPLPGDPPARVPRTWKQRLAAKRAAAVARRAQR
jgi:hypothetical protein